MSRRERIRANRQQSPLLKRPFSQPFSPLAPLNLLPPPQIEQLHEASMHILENVGLDFFDDEALAIWQQAGAKVDHASRHVWPDRGLIMEAIAHAPSQFTWRARNPAHSVAVGGNALTFGPCGGMVYATDLDKGRRPGVQADYENLLRLTQLCPVIHFGPWGQTEMHDVGVNIRHLHRLHAGIRLTDKALMEAAHGRIITSDNLEMARIVFGSLAGDPVIGDVVNVNSPLRYDDRMLGGLITYARAGQVTFITPFILAGAMSPVTMAAAIAQQNAEALAGIALTQLVRPGAPVIYGGFTTNTDLKSGSPAFGTPEGAWALLVGGQLARYYKLPYRSSGSLTNANIPDAQAAYETAWTMWPAVLAHSNLMMHAIGWLESGLTASFEKFVIDAENLAMFATFLESFTVSPETLALEMIAEVGPGGHHFGTSHTQERYRDAFYQSEVAERAGFETWQGAGGQDALQRANGIWKAWLKQYEPPPLDEAVAEELTAFIARRERELVGVDVYG